MTKKIAVFVDIECPHCHKGSKICLQPYQLDLIARVYEKMKKAVNK